MHRILATCAKGFSHRGVRVLLVLAVYFVLAPTMPHVAHQGLYTISLLIKDLLMWMLPLTVGLFIAHAISSFRHHAPLFILTLLLFEGLSNLSSVWYAYVGGHIAADFLPTIEVASANTVSFDALWRLPLAKPSWWSADKGSILGLALGVLAALTQKLALQHAVNRGKEIAQWVLTRIFSRLIPLFVLGFVARMYQTQVLQHVWSHYSALLVWLVFFLVVYLLILFAIGSGSSLIRAVKNLLPAGGIAFTSGCSISTMPWTIDGTSKNLRDPQFAKAVIPATTNIQQIGDCIANTFLCFLIYRHFFGHSPDWMTWVSFSLVFVLARFATAAVLGGAIFIMLPIYEAYLGFNAEMIAIILAFNIILDPIITSSNVVANGALCTVFEKVWISALRAAYVLFPKLAPQAKKEVPSD